MVFPHQFLRPRKVAVRVHPLNAHQRARIFVFLKEVVDVLIRVISRLEEYDRVDSIRQPGQQAQGLVRQAVVARTAPVHPVVMAVRQIVEHEHQQDSKAERDQRVQADRELALSPGPDRAPSRMAMFHRYFHFLDSIALIVANSINALTVREKTTGRVSTAPREKSSMCEIEET